MHQRDFILRMIEQLGAALAEVRRMILGGKGGSAAREALVRTASQAGTDVTLLKGFSLDTLHMLIAPTGEVDSTRCWLFAEVLYLDGLESVLSEGDGRDSLLKARALYDLIRPAGGLLVGMPEAAERIAEIDQRLEELGEIGPGTTSGRARRVRARPRPRSRVILQSPILLQG